jgi:GT2 family glycosyltransferase/lipopolysaccharide/colanic/teichoic acid biosynthesis glycosyltransferase
MSVNSNISLSNQADSIRRARTKTKQQQVELSVIVVNYKVKEFLEQALISVKKSLKNIISEIIVVDNASRDGSSELIRKRFPEVKLLVNTENLGFAKASNQGLHLAQGEFIALLNPDTIVQEDTFSSMLDFFKNHPDTGMLGCKILNPDGTLQLACRRSFPSPWVAFTKLCGLSHLFKKSKLFGKYNLTYLDPDLSYEVEAISGSFMLIQRKILDEVGYLDESFFLYGEDLDWCYRIREKGWKVRYFADTKIIHFKGESSKRTEIDNLKAFYQAMRLFVRKHFKRKYLLIPYWLLLVAIWIRAALSIFKRIFISLSIPLADFVFLNVALVLGVYLRFGDFSDLRSFIPVNIVYSLIVIASLHLFGCYDKHKFSSSKSGLAVLFGFLFIASLTYFLNQFAYSRLVILLDGILSLVIISGWRLLLKFLPRIGLMPLKGTLGKTLLARNTVIVGDFASGEKLVEKLNSQIDVGYNIAGLVSVNGRDTGQTYGGMKVLGSVDYLNSIIQEKKIHEVIFSTSRLSYDQILGIIARSRNQRVNFKLVPSNLEVIIGKASIERLEDLPLLEIDYKLHQNRYRYVKRMFDVFFAMGALVFTMPIYLYKRLLTSTELRKILIQGEHNKAITVCEFADTSPNFVKRIPFFWSILKGDLSLVGSEILEVGENSKSSPNMEMELKPGLTGLVQVNSHRHLTKEDREKYQLYYLKNYSVLLDLEILFKAIFKI